jgi:protein-tyrosine phosphatase
MTNWTALQQPSGRYLTPGPDRRAVLFLCTGNYYRSRFAEELWHHLESKDPSGWRAESRGLFVAQGPPNIGHISPYARYALGVEGVRLSEPVRQPRQVGREDLVACSHIVAMSESEHRRMVQSLFPEWANLVEYWDIEDVEVCPVETAMKELRVRVCELRVRLGRAP